uniref:Uncharacterized protein n=1 Tax=Oryza meridionalis TaxID=40149 RepID=A0A0E0E156_9ORYZ
MAAAVAAQLRGPSAARRWPAPSGGVLRFAPLATSTVPASIARGSLRGVPAGVVLPKPLIAMCMKAEYTSSPVDPNAVTEHTEDENQQPTTVSPTNAEIDIDQEAVPQHKGAIIHDFCLGIPFAVAAAVAWKHFQAYTTTKKLLPWAFYTALSAAMICFYSYVLLAGGNPPPKKKAVAQ